MEESGGPDAIHVSEKVDTNKSGLDDSRPCNKGKHQHPGDRLGRDPLKGGGSYHFHSPKGMHHLS